MREFYHSESFFNSTAAGGIFTGYQDYDADEYIRERNAEIRIQEVESLFEKNKKLDLPKIACGYGTLLKIARKKGHNAEGIDLSDVMVKNAKQKYNLKIIHNDFLKHDFGSRKYDAIILYGALNNFLSPIDVAKKIYGLLFVIHIL